MKKLLLLVVSITLLLFTSVEIFAQDSTNIKIGKQHKHGKGFIDLDGDGYNDNAPDHDGDGIPNGLDPDYRKKQGHGFIDLDGDGINDNAGFGRRKNRKAAMHSMKTKKDFLHNYLENSLGRGMKEAHKYGNHHFNGFGFGFGFSHGFGNSDGTGNGSGNNGNHDGPWNWGKHLGGHGNGGH